MSVGPSKPDPAPPCRLVEVFDENLSIKGHAICLSARTHRELGDGDIVEMSKLESITYLKSEPDLMQRQLKRAIGRLVRVHRKPAL